MVTKVEKERYRKISELGCSLCRHQGNEGTPAELHHIRRSGVRSKSPVIPLCTYHHQEYGITEEQLLEKTENLIA